MLFGLMQGMTGRNKIVTSSVEHKSVREPCRALRQNGLQVVELPVSSNCVIDLNAATDMIDESTALVTIQGANNEVGVLQPIDQLSEIAQSKGAFFHCDAAQMVGKVALPAGFSSYDFSSFSAHKIYGPKGIGVLIVRNGIPRKTLRPVLLGGNQEGGLRPGTLNVPAIVGLGEACRIAKKRIDEDIRAIGLLRNGFELAIGQAVSNCRHNAREAARLPGTSSLSIPDVPATILIPNVPHLCISDGSACNSGAPEPSHVLLAMGLSRSDAECTVRISFGRDNTVADVEEAVATIAKAVDRIRGCIADGADGSPLPARRSRG